MNLKKFLKAYTVTDRSPSGTKLTGYSRWGKDFVTFMNEWEGTTFQNGMYRIHTIDSISKYTQLVEGMFSATEGLSLRLLRIG